MNTPHDRAATPPVPTSTKTTTTTTTQTQTQTSTSTTPTSTTPALATALDTRTEDPAADHARLCQEIDTLDRLLADLAVEERDVNTQLQSLKCAVHLTRGEVERRQRANSELGTTTTTTPITTTTTTATTTGAGATAVAGFAAATPASQAHERVTDDSSPRHRRDAPHSPFHALVSPAPHGATPLSPASHRSAGPPDVTISSSLLSFFSGDTTTAMPATATAAAAAPSSPPEAEQSPVPQQHHQQQQRSPRVSQLPQPQQYQQQRDPQLHVTDLDDVTRLETELQSLKRDVASVLFETEDLEASVRRHRAALRDAAPVPPDDPVSPRLAAMAAAPGANASRPLALYGADAVTSLPPTSATASEAPTPASILAPALAVTTAAGNGSDGGVTATATATVKATASPRLGPKTSPRTRPARLIGEVDALLSLGSCAHFEPCRLGVSATGQLGVYSYASPAPLLLLDEAGAQLREVVARDEQAALMRSLVQTDVQISGVTHRMCGLREAVAGALLLVRDARGQAGGLGAQH